MTKSIAMVACAGGASSQAEPPDEVSKSLAGTIGLTTGGLNFQRRRGELTLLSLPRFVRDELGIQLIDLNTHWLETFDPQYLEQVRGVADECGCSFTNLKVNHQFGDLYSRDPDERSRTIAIAQRLIQVARLLGSRWIRFTFPSPQVPGMPLNPVAHRELATYAEQFGVQLLVENLGWMTRDAHSVSKLLMAIGRNAASCPDIGNWSDEIRYAGLAATFPTAASCDFKAFELNQDFQHSRYDLHRCFRIGWQAGFRGPWVLEHSNENTPRLIHEIVALRDRVRQWISEAA